jgi:hypothetical protein
MRSSRWHLNINIREYTDRASVRLLEAHEQAAPRRHLCAKVGLFGSTKGGCHIGYYHGLARSVDLSANPFQVYGTGGVGHAVLFSPRKGQPLPRPICAAGLSKKIKFLAHYWHMVHLLPSKLKEDLDGYLTL